MTDKPQTTLDKPIRGEYRPHKNLAEKIAASLINFPLRPRPEDDPNEYYTYLEESFAKRIEEILVEDELSCATKQ